MSEEAQEKAKDFILTYGIWFYTVGLILMAGFGSGEIATSAFICICMMIATALVWFRLPIKLREIMTNQVVAILMDIGIGWMGWFILPNSMHAKLAFVLFHIAISLSLIWEHKRLRGLLFKNSMAS